MAKITIVGNGRSGVTHALLKCELHMKSTRTSFYKCSKHFICILDRSIICPFTCPNGNHQHMWVGRTSKRTTIILQCKDRSGQEDLWFNVSGCLYDVYQLAN